MSDAPDNDRDEQGGQQGGQPPQGGQPQGGQPPGGQPQGGQPQGGQPQRGQYQQQAYQTGPGVGDIFNRAGTASEMKIGIVTYAAVSLGLGIAGFGLSLASGGGPGAGGVGAGGVFGGAGFLMIIGAILLTPLLGGVLGLRMADRLEDEPGNLVYGTAAVVGFVGTLVSFIIGIIFFMIAAGGGGVAGGLIGQLILPIIVACIGVAIVTVIAAWAGQSLLPGAGSQQRAQQRPAQGQH